MKICTKCLAEQCPSQFTKMRQAKDGLRPICKSCDRAWRRKNLEARMAYQRQYREENPEYISALNAAWMKKNAEHQKVMKQKYQQERPYIKAAICARYAAAKKKATPAWANLGAIKLIYAEAARLTRKTGIEHQVDHIYPLQSDVVCGLHVEANLQILTAFANQSKSNRISVP